MCICSEQQTSIVQRNHRHTFWLIFTATKSEKWVNCNEQRALYELTNEDICCSHPFVVQSAFLFVFLFHFYRFWWGALWVKLVTSPTKRDSVKRVQEKLRLFVYQITIALKRKAFVCHCWPTKWGFNTFFVYLVSSPFIHRKVWAHVKGSKLETAHNLVVNYSSLKAAWWSGPDGMLLAMARNALFMLKKFGDI